MQGLYPFPMSLPVVPASDGAGVVVEVGPKVTDFKAGDKVCTLFNQAHQAGPMSFKAIQSGLGGAIDGTLREYALFEETGLVKMPDSLSFEEGSTLSCAAVTAWNALYGLTPVKPGDVVLTQGTGGVSIFALQFAVAAGATVIATTSSAEKGKKLKELGATHVINYKEDKNWGESAKKLTPNGEGAAHIIEVGGPGTFEQSLKAVKMEGIVSVIGFLGGKSWLIPPGLTCYIPEARRSYDKTPELDNSNLDIRRRRWPKPFGCFEQLVYDSWYLGRFSSAIQRYERRNRGEQDQACCRLHYIQIRGCEICIRIPMGPEAFRQGRHHDSMRAGRLC